MMGGHPGSVNMYRFLKDSDVLDHLARRDMIEDMSELSGSPVELGLREQNFTQRSQDVYAVAWSAAGGYGDPMERDPARVAEDVRDGAITAAAARDIYSVALDEDTQQHDAEATTRLRDRVRRSRIGNHGKECRKLTGRLLFQATDNLAVRMEGEIPYHCCAKCDTQLGPLTENYKTHWCGRTAR
jgi:N-methylhydantoinase B